MASDRRSLALPGLAVGGLAGGLLVALVVAWGRPALHDLIGYAGLMAIAVPVVVSTALAGGISGRMIGLRGASRGSVWTASVFGLLATVPAQALALVIGGHLGGAWGEHLLEGRLGVWIGMLVGIVALATPLIAAAAGVGSIVARIGAPMVRASAKGEGPE